MAHQIRCFTVRVTTKINVYQWLALGLALGTVIINMPGSGGGGVG